MCPRYLDLGESWLMVIPQVVDWNNGKVHAGDSESEILKMLGAWPKEA